MAGGEHRVVFFVYLYIFVFSSLKQPVAFTSPRPVAGRYEFKRWQKMMMDDEICKC